MIAITGKITDENIENLNSHVIPILCSEHDIVKECVDEHLDEIKVEGFVDNLIYEDSGLSVNAILNEGFEDYYISPIIRKRNDDEFDFVACSLVKTKPEEHSKTIGEMKI
jgi:hypothetical protein